MLNVWVVFARLNTDKMELKIKLSKASKYIGTKEIPFKGEDLDLVKMFIKDAFIAGIDQGQSLPIDSVLGQIEQLCEHDYKSGTQSNNCDVSVCCKCGDIA